MGLWYFNGKLITVLLSLNTGMGTWVSDPDLLHYHCCSSLFSKEECSIHNSAIYCTIQDIGKSRISVFNVLVY